MKATAKELLKVATLLGIFTIGFICIFMVPGLIPMGQWIAAILGAWLTGILSIYIGCRLYKRWKSAGWLKKYDQWVEEADKAPNPMRRWEE